MKTWIVLISCLSFTLVNGQNNEPIDLGIGFTIAKNPYLFEDMSHPKNIFSDSLLTKRIKTDKIIPFFYKPDYGLYHFICLEKYGKYYKILINDSEIGFVPNDRNYIFKTWDAILMSASVQRIDKLNLFKNKPNESDTNYVINTCKNDVLKVIDIIESQGEFWLEVSFAIKCETYIEADTELKTGWIKWRDFNKLLVRILLLH
ncbi:MAG: hypothetical protein WAO74_02455 [Polaribacter sp.]|uniref:hypothetical protein n=1 Tax=Polaribacter sp. TaxID=1920175 RepID=UPI003BAF3E3D